jgi:hypothetical protein
MRPLRSSIRCECIALSENGLVLSEPHAGASESVRKQDFLVGDELAADIIVLRLRHHEARDRSAICTCSANQSEEIW